MEFIECSCKKHRASGSIYPKNKVPKDLFRKYPDKSESTALFKTCTDCRKHEKMLKLKRKTNNQTAPTEKFKACSSKIIQKIV